MNNSIILLAGLLALALMTTIKPINKWWHSLLREQYLFLFVFPISILFGWPFESLATFREGQELGWQRYLRIILFATFVAFFILNIKKNRNLAIPASPIFLTFSFYAGFCALSTFWSPEPMQTLWKSAELFIVLMVAIQLYQAREYRVERAVAIADTLMFFAFSLCVMSIVGGVLAPERAWLDWGMDGLGVRSMGGVVPSINANMLGQLGGIVALVGINRLIVNQNAMSWSSLIIPLIGVTTLLLAYSRTSLIAFILILVITLLVLKKNRWIVRIIFISGIVGFLFVDFFMTYLARGQDAEQFASLSGRTQMWEAALIVFTEKPIIGHGFFVGHKFVALSNGQFLATVDNTYIETLVNVGVIGCFLIILFAAMSMVYAVRMLSRSRKKSPAIREASLVFFTIIIFTIVRSATASSFQVLHYNLIFLLFSLVGFSLVGKNFNLSNH